MINLILNRVYRLKSNPMNFNTEYAPLGVKRNREVSHDHDFACG
jgi:hypothetical protein